MKRKNHLFVLLLIYLICSAKSCTDDENAAKLNEKQLISAAKDSIKQVIQVDFPSDQLLRAYEATAKQKLTDFADYLNIASDTSMDAGFRQQASKMAGKLFISREVGLGKWGRSYSGTNIHTLDQLLKECLSGGLPSQFRPDKMEIETLMKQVNDSTFRGNLSFYPASDNSVKMNISSASSSRMVMDIYALKKVKSFGKEKVAVWNVFLGDID